MGFRSAIKKGGGFLNNVDGVLKGYEFTARFKDEKKDGEWVYFVPQVLTDGADDPIDQHMFLGASEKYSISKDGQELTMEDGSPVTFGFSTPFGIFMDSLLNAAEKANYAIEEDLPDLEKGEALSLESQVDKRFRFKQQVDEEGTKKFGKRVSGSGKNKREYDRTNTIIDAILGEAKGGGKTNTSKGPSSKKTADLDGEAADVLKDILEKGEVNRKNLSLPVTKALMKNDNKVPLKEMILDEDWQDKQDWLTVDKKGNLSVE